MYTKRTAGKLNKWIKSMAWGKENNHFLDLCLKYFVFVMDF